MLTKGITGATQIFGTNNATKTAQTGNELQFSKKGAK